ncbi:MAG TPA: cyclopropane fatty acyl phospholipid synthase [Gammaproteobacteria bacterium]|nr:cyclopropane fatty acyl phospholipid synthase [Gammaproteobacteria bacterium]
MSQRRFRRKVEQLLADTGIRVDGREAWDLKVHDARVFGRVLAHGSLGLGESYMDGWWDAEDLDGFACRLMLADIEEHVHSWDDILHVLHARLTNLQKPSRAFEVGQRHYDMGNALYKRMLDRRMIYSCGYWKQADTLDAAQEAKLELIFRKLGLTAGMRVLDIGCGWGGALRLAAERYGIEGVGITVSEQQAQYARESCRGLPVDIRLQDYRLLDEKFDRIFSVGMFEHVGSRNYRTYMQVARRCLKPDGLFLLHCIGNNYSVRTTDAWIARYIFPNGMLPSIRQIGSAIEHLFVMEDWHNFSAHYDRTLMAWRGNFEAHWDELKQEYGTMFYRMWRYYLSVSAASFRARKAQLWQIVLSPRGVPGGYESLR